MSRCPSTAGATSIGWSRHGASWAAGSTAALSLSARDVVLMESDKTVQGRSSEQPKPTPPEPVPPVMPEASRRRVTIFRVLAVIPVLVFLVAEANLLAPWVFLLDTEDNPEPNKWFHVVSGAADIFMLVIFVCLIIRPRLPALAAWIAVSLTIVGVKWAVLLWYRLND